jgi:hypothetical protein
MKLSLKVLLYFKANAEWGICHVRASSADLCLSSIFRISWTEAMNSKIVPNNKTSV